MPRISDNIFAIKILLLGYSTLASQTGSWKSDLAFLLSEDNYDIIESDEVSDEFYSEIVDSKSIPPTFVNLLNYIKDEHRLIELCDLIVVNVEDATSDIFIRMMLGYSYSKDIIVIIDKSKKSRINPWILVHVTHIAESVMEVAEIIKERYPAPPPPPPPIDMKQLLISNN